MCLNYFYSTSSSQNVVNDRVHPLHRRGRAEETPSSPSPFRTALLAHLVTNQPLQLQDSLKFVGKTQWVFLSPPLFFAIFKDFKNLNLLVLDLGGRACLAAEVVQADRDRSLSRVAPIPSFLALLSPTAACRGLCHRPEDHQLAGHAEQLLAAAHLEQLRVSQIRQKND